MHFLELFVKFARFRAVGHYYLVEDELLDDFLINGVLFKLKVVVVDGLTFDDLVIIFWVIQLFQEWMLEDLLCGEPFLGVESEEFLHQVDCFRWCVWNQLSQALSFDTWCFIFHVLEVLLTPDLLLDFLIW